MKKMTILILIIMLTSLWAGGLQEYVEKPDFKNFLRTADSLNKVNSQIELAYLMNFELARQIAKLDSNFSELDLQAKFSLANLKLDMGKYEPAVAIYEKINQQFPKWSCPWRHKGEAFFKSGKLEKAEQALQKAIETRKQHYDAYVMLAEVQKEQNEYRQALETLQEGMKYKNKDIEEGEVDELEVDFLMLELLELNHETTDELEERLKQQAPDHPYWQK
jgi:tetratricopeptide (TPR) repeat protein